MEVGGQQFQWHGEALKRDLERASRRGLAAAAEVLSNRIRINLSRPGTPTSDSGWAKLERAQNIQKMSRSMTRIRFSVGSLSTLQLKRRAVKLAGRLHNKVERYAGKKENRNWLRAAELIATNGLVDRPGGMPRLRTGRLRGSVGYERDGDGLIVGAASKYARIHELGGTINHPGGSPFIKILGRLIFLKKGSSAALNRGAGVTGPHKITIPARPYIKPSLNTERNNMMAAFAATVRAELEGSA